MERSSTCATLPMCMMAARRKPTVVHVDGKSAVLLAVVKAGATSTLIDHFGIKQLLPSVAQTLPASLKTDGGWRSVRCS